jgi:DNA modification methylase
MVGSCLERLKDLPDESIDSVVTDPPYELSFMGKGWDGSGIAYSVELWAECLRVLKPGGHLLAFGGTRTYHRMAVAIEDAGFEIRDSIQWVYGSGFPKSLDVSKAIDKQRHDRADILKVTAWVRKTRDAAEVTNKDIDTAFGFAGMSSHWTSPKSQPAVPTLDQVPQLLQVLGVAAEEVPEDIRRLLWDLNGKKGQPGENWAKREVVGRSTNGIAGGTGRHTNEDDAYGFAAEFNVTAAATDAAKTWQGWGTALKPAHEPIVLARKPLAGTVAATVLAHGTGALNIDGCRVGSEVRHNASCLSSGNTAAPVMTAGRETAGRETAGRWPANIIFDEAAGAELDAQSGTRPTSKPGSVVRRKAAEEYKNNSMGKESRAAGTVEIAYGDEGGAARFFYCPKPGKKERNAGLDGLPLVRHSDRVTDDLPGGDNPRNRTNATKTNFHPTVKPLALIRYLQRLVTPPGGTTLDPFMGSGTSAAAAILEGFEWRGCEMTAEYLPIITARVKWATKEKRKEQPKLPLKD